MIGSIWNTIIYNPLYNGFIFLADILPWADLGVIIILFTLVIKLILFPLSIRATKTQQAVRTIEPEIKKLREKYKNDKQTQALEVMELYKEHNIKPFSGFLTILIQIPIIFGLYFIFLRGGLPMVNADILYSFVKVPEMINTTFLGVMNVTGKSIILALLTGITQFFHTKISFKNQDDLNDKKLGEGSLKDDFVKTMKLQMKYVLPVFVAVISYTLSAAIALYWTTSNIFHIVQELYVERMVRNPKKKDESPAPQSS